MTQPMTHFNAWESCQPALQALEHSCSLPVAMHDTLRRVQGLSAQQEGSADYAAYIRSASLGSLQ
jgi:hypothetical protein